MAGAGVNDGIVGVVCGQDTVISAVGEEELDVAVRSITFGLSIGLINGTCVRVDLGVLDGENAVRLQAVPRLNTVSVLEGKTLVSCDLIPCSHILGSVEI